MSKDDILEFANQTTPSSVQIPAGWTGLIVWAVGKWGIGVIFAAFLVPVYQDLKESNKRVAEITSANVQVLTQLANKIEESNAKIQRVEDAMRLYKIDRP